MSILGNAQAVLARLLLEHGKTIPGGFVPTINPVQTAEVTAAISRASARTGVDFDYLLAQAKLESDLNPNAKSPTSSATGLFQFIDSTWLRVLDQHGSKHGMAWADNALGPNSQAPGLATRDQLLSLRFDIDTSSIMAAELARDNAAGLRTTLGREPAPTELYLAHFLGLSGAQKFLGVLENNPDQSAASLMPQAARANRSIFYDGSTPRSVQQVMALMQGKVEAAYGGSPPASAGAVIAPDPVISADQSTAREPAKSTEPPLLRHARRTRGSFAPMSLPSMEAPRASMADRLLSTFGEAGPGSGRANEHVASAYSKFKALGL